jgi:hypothetical protein
MATAYIIELPGMTSEQSAAVLRNLGLSSTPPAGQILHLEGPMEAFKGRLAIMPLAG